MYVCVYVCVCIYIYIALQSEPEALNTRTAGPIPAPDVVGDLLFCLLLPLLLQKLQD